MPLQDHFHPPQLDGLSPKIEPPFAEKNQMKKKADHSPSGKAPKVTGMPQWKAKVDQYRTDELAVLTFGSEKDLHAALDLVWVGKLQGMPFHVVPDGASLA